MNEVIFDGIFYLRHHVYSIISIKYFLWNLHYKAIKIISNLHSHLQVHLNKLECPWKVHSFQ